MNITLKPGGYIVKHGSRAPVYVGLQMTQPMRQDLEAMAKRAQKSMSEFIRDLIAERAQQSLIPQETNGHGDDA